MYSVSSCETSSPPTTARPSGRRDSAPAPIPRAIGSVPTSAAIVVIMMGRKRTRQASWIASRGDLPCSRCASTAKSTIMMPFFFTRPTSMMMPTKAYRLISVLKTSSVSSAPKPADGSPERIVSGWVKLSIQRKERLPFDDVVAFLETDGRQLARQLRMNGNRGIRLDAADGSHLDGHRFLLHRRDRDGHS